MRKNVLVFPCGSEIGLEIYRSLYSSTHFTIYGGSSVSDHGQYVYKNYIDNIPLVVGKNFITEINRIVKKYNIDFIFPAHDSVVLTLSKAAAKGELKCAVITSEAKTCDIARSKRKTYQLFKGIIPVPIEYKRNLIAEDMFPLFLKPEVGQGSKGTYLAESLKDIDFYLAKNSSLMILEHLPGNEYTIDCFTDSSGELLFCEGRRRRRIVNGISVNSEVVEDPQFIDYAKKINSKLKLNGAWFFQVKESVDGTLKLLEIAPRVAGTMGLARCKGVNLPLLSLFNALGLKVDITENEYHLTIDRSLENRYQHDIDYNQVYLDFDDLILIDGKVNPAVMAFIYQCHNKDIQVSLITKHRSDIVETLQLYRLDEVFNEILHIDDNDQKFKYITNSHAIFIDDSFAERKSVYENCKIPVFDSHMIESLMEPF